MAGFPTTLLSLFPESGLKNKLRCLLYNKRQKTFNFSFNKGVYVVKCKGQLMFFYQNPYHLFSEFEEYFLHYRPKSGDTVIDAGAYIGVFSIYAAKLVEPHGKVYAFEPDPGSFSRLKKNVELNGLNIHLVQKGLWSSDSDLTIRSGLELGSSFMKKETQGMGAEVKVTTIDSVLFGEEITGTLFIKMNIEGSEVEALKGAAETIKNHKPHFTIRDHIVAGKLTDAEVEDCLKTYNYSVKTFLEMAEPTTFGTPSAL